MQAATVPDQDASLPALDFFGPSARLHHVGIAVPSISAACPACQSIEDTRQRVRVAFATVHGAPIELIEPAADDSPVLESLRKGNRLVHLCFEVDSHADALAASRPFGFRAISTPVPAPAFGGAPILWVFHQVYGLVELIERRPMAGAAPASTDNGGPSR